MGNYINGLTGYEVYTSVQEQYQLNSGTATVQLRCKWEDRHTVVKAAIEGGAGSYPIDFPQQLEGRGGPYVPGEGGGEGGGTKLVANSVSIDPMPTQYDTDGQEIQYKFALITIGYQMLATTISIDSTNQYFKINPDGLYWKINNSYEPLSQEEAPGVRLASFDVSLAHPHMKLLTENGTISSYEGHVNESDVIVRHNGFEFTFPAQTLLCTTPSIRSGVTLFGSGFNDVSLKLSYNPLTHNEFFNPKQDAGTESGKIEDHKTRIYKKTGDSSSDSDSDYEEIDIYPTKDFKPLFKAFGIKIGN